MALTLFRPQEQFLKVTQVGLISPGSTAKGMPLQRLLASGFLGFFGLMQKHC